MDILRKELEEFYFSQHLDREELPLSAVPVVCGKAANLREITNGCAVITDCSCDHCYVYSGDFGNLMGYAAHPYGYFEADSSDEDVIYERIHPEDLVDKRLLEYEFFKFVDSKDPMDKPGFIAKCRLRMSDKDGEYRLVDNTTQIIQLSPAGKAWLILCTYSLSTIQTSKEGIAPCIINTKTGEIVSFAFSDKRAHILTDREKQILILIKEGKLSKQIADSLGISIHTVNRHRQNILEKLSVNNSAEAVAAATSMNLL